MANSPWTRFNGSRQLKQFQVTRAAFVPVAIVRARSVHVAHTNSWKFLLRDDVWSEKGVRDVTEKLREAALAF